MGVGSGVLYGREVLAVVLPKLEEHTRRECIDVVVVKRSKAVPALDLRRG